MARIRTLKPEFWQNEKLSALSIEDHYLAAALLNYADDFGYFNANPGLIRAACCPLREDFGNIPEILGRLQTMDYLRLSKGEDGRAYGWVVNFSEHQKVSHPTPSKIAPLADFPEILQSPPESFRPDLGTGNREQGTGKRPAGPLAGFDVFYSAFPKKRSRGDAEKAWIKIRPNAEFLAVILAGLEKAKVSDEWRKENGKYIPHPASWLNSKGWEDEFIPPLRLIPPEDKPPTDWFARFSTISGNPEGYTNAETVEAATRARTAEPQYATRIDAWITERGLTYATDPQPA